MVLLQLFVLALIQGVTEFLPISSSGHLVLVSEIACWPDQGLPFDIAVHVGTLGAVMVYFWRDMGALLVGFGRILTLRGGPPARLLGNLVVATLPILIVGFFFIDEIAVVLRSVEVVAWTTIGFAILLWAADRIGMTVWRIDHLTPTAALGLGVAQVFALIPGVSRSGVTMTAARALGMERQDAARFSLLMSIPTILGAAALSGYGAYAAGETAVTRDMLLAAAVSFVTALLAIAVMMQWLKRAGFGPFVLYRLILGAGLLYWVYFTPGQTFCG